MTTDNKRAADEAKLLPCPMCGFKAHITSGYCEGPQWPGNFHRVYCGSCQLRQLFYKTPSEAVTAWNRRAALSSRADSGSDALTKAAEKYDAMMKHLGGCTDGGCVIVRPKGMHTNGGCKCPRDQVKMTRAIYAANELRAAIAKGDSK